MTFFLPSLEYNIKDLEPYVSSKTVSVHYEKHHKGYVINLNKLIDNNSYFVNSSLEKVIMDSYEKKEYVSLFNNAAQVWNHNFYWKSMSSSGGNQSTSKLLVNKIINDFGSFSNFKDNFVKIAMSQFGSGWVWLVLNNDKLEVISTSNANNPLVTKHNPLLVCDVWEHAYYIDYNNRRLDYVNSFLNYLSNWEFAEKNFQGYYLGNNI